MVSTGFSWVAASCEIQHQQTHGFAWWRDGTSQQMGLRTALFI